MTNSDKSLLTLLFAVSLLAVPVASFGQGFSDDFESYTPGQDVPDPWFDWASGLSPATNNAVVLWSVVGMEGHNGSDQYLAVKGEPIRWFDNPYDAKDRIVDVTFYVRTSAVSRFDLYAGSMGWTPFAAPTEQYDTNIGELHINHHIIWSPSYAEWYEVSYAGQTDTENFVVDGEFWNEIKIHTVVRSISTMMGEGELFVNGVGTGQKHIWSLNPTYAFSGVDFYAWPMNEEWHIDDFSVLQNGFADPIDIPAPDYVYPSTMGSGGGITSDGTRYLYILGGGNSAATGSTELWRFDTTTETWDQLPSSPTVPKPGDPSQVLQWQTRRAALTTAGSQGRISVTMNGPYVTPAPWSVDYDIATNTWDSPVAPDPTQSSHDVFTDSTAAGDRVYATQTASQPGMLIYDAGTRTFHGRQHSPNNFPFGWKTGNDLAYADDGNNWLYGLAARDRDPTLGTDWVAVICRYDVTQPPPGSWDRPGGSWWYSDLPIPLPTLSPSDRHGLTYVPAGVSNIYILHSEWGETGLFKIDVVGGALYAAIDGSDDLYKYDVGSNTWTTITDALPFEFGGNDDMTFGTPAIEDPVLTISKYDENNVELSWDSVTTHKYKLWESTDIENWSLSEDWQNGTGATMSVVKSTIGVDKKFYKLERESLP